MKHAARFFTWLGTPIRAGRALFPFTYEGRQTLIYLMCALTAPILTLTVIWMLDTLAGHKEWDTYSEIAKIVAYSLLISVCAFSMFVAFRSLSLGSKDGLLNLSGKDSQPPPPSPSPVAAAQAVADKVTQGAQAAVAAVAVETAAANPTPATNPAGEPL